LIELNETDLVLQRHPEFDGCLYSVDSDGSGVHFSSRLRPLLNMRPRYRSSLPLGWKDIKEFIESAGEGLRADRERALLCVACETLARRSELVALEVE
jgi:integrase